MPCAQGTTVIRRSKASAARQNRGDLLNHVQYRRDSVLITKRWQTGRRSGGSRAFRAHPRVRDEFPDLTDRIGQTDVVVRPEVAENEIDEAVAHARRAVTRTRKRR